MKKIIIAIIITLVAMIIIISTLLIIINKSNKEETQGDAGEVINYAETKVEAVTDSIDFFSIRNCIQRYLDIININSSIYENENGIIDQTSISKSIYDVLSEEYIKENKITTNNILEKIDKIEEKLIFVPLKMNYLELEINDKYAVYGFCQTQNNQYVKDIYFVVNVDNENKTFSIEPLKDEHETIDEIKLNRNEIKIKSNENNIYIDQVITDQYLCEQIFLIQKRMMLAKPEESYNYLDEEYKNKRFKTLEEYKKYISENKNHISKISIRGYEVNRLGDNSEYICTDQYNNYYIFKEKEVLNYTVKLDAYTIEDERIEEEYNKYNTQKKVSYNANKWIQMINNKDYESAYNLLNETFKNTNWKTVDEFKKYIEQNYPSYYQIESGQYQAYGTNHSITCILKDLDGNNQKSITIIMKLNENMDFEMSFNK